MLRSRLRLAVAAIGLTLIAAGCSGVPSTTSPPPASGSTSVPSTSDASNGLTAEAFLAKTTAGANTVKTLRMQATTAVAMSGESVEAEASGEMDRSDPKNVKMSVTIAGAGLSYAVVTNGDDYYIKTEGTWYLLTPEQVAQSGVGTPGDPAEALGKLGDHIQSVTVVGTEKVDGVPTTHYRLAIDSGALQELAGATPSGDLTTFPYDVWLDENDVMRKYTADAGQTFTMSGTQSRINEPVTIKTPASAEPLPES